MSYSFTSAEITRLTMLFSETEALIAEQRAREREIIERNLIRTNIWTPPSELGTREQLEIKLKASEEKLKREKERANFMRKELTAMKWKMERMEEGNEQKAPKPKLAAPSCEICTSEYSAENPDKTPRILKCGHTLCEECAGMMANGRNLMCPFDRKSMKLKEAGVIALPRNYAIIQMIERK